MHRSKLSTFVIDCKTQDLDAAARFWAEALGRRVNPAQPGDDRYRDLECAPSEPMLMIQRVEHESRIHLDVESDDIEAEVRRLEALGARRVEAVRTWVVLEAPTGQRFCVVKPQRGPVVLGATTWPSSATLPFEAGAQHERLRGLAGRYVGHTKTWLEPGAPPDESPSELRVDPLLGGRFLRFEEQGFFGGKARAGEMCFGFHADAGRYEMSWIDSFHTGSAIMTSTGPAREDGVIAVTGSYGAGAETWGWRTEIHAGAELVMRAFNITPAGEEFPAIETVWRRLGG
jgi:hypothetical protein